MDTSQNTMEILAFFLITILNNIQELGHSCYIASIDDFIIHGFGFNDDPIEIGCSRVECTFRILRRDNDKSFNKMINYATIIIFNQFNALICENPFAGELEHELLIKSIRKTFFLVFKNLQYGDCSTKEFIQNIQAIPFYTENLVIKQATNQFIILSAQLFCPIDHAEKISELLV